jgi:hypothetical protein
MKHFEELMLAATPTASVALCTLTAFAADEDRRAKKAHAHAPVGEFMMIYPAHLCGSATT